MAATPESATGPLTGRTALVTGASRGIGRAIAERLAGAGARIAVHYHTRAEEARSTAAGLAGSGHRLFPADLGQVDERRRLIRKVASEMEGPHILVNNAGIYRLTPLLDSPETVWLRDFEDLVNLNLVAPAHLACLCARIMAERGIAGRIINVGSRGAYRGEPDAPGYGAAKAGLHALTQSLAQALGPHHIAVTAIAPGWVGTDMAKPHLESPRGAAIRAQSPLGRTARPGEVAALALYLAGDDAEYATGAVVDLNGASYLR
jgi:NAD(P)-dependent dehydrogenase (short-subunit alcohol dehydrogenase family)